MALAVVRRYFDVCARSEDASISDKESPVTVVAFEPCGQSTLYVGADSGASFETTAGDLFIRRDETKAFRLSAEGGAAHVIWTYSGAEPFGDELRTSVERHRWSGLSWNDTLGNFHALVAPINRRMRDNAKEQGTRVDSRHLLTVVGGGVIDGVRRVFEIEPNAGQAFFHRDAARVVVGTAQKEVELAARAIKRFDPSADCEGTIRAAMQAALEWNPKTCAPPLRYYKIARDGIEELASDS